MKTNIKGHVLIRDAVTQEVLVDKNNAIHFENMSEAMASSLANRSSGHIHQMAFGNGASIVSGTGAITYFPPNVTDADARLYNETYVKVINDQSPLNTNPNANSIRVQHGTSNVFSDIVVTCLLDFNEPSGQDLFDDATDGERPFVFDEIALKSYDTTGKGKLLTHVIFHPVQKSLNRSIEIIYTLRVYLS